MPLDLDGDGAGVIKFTPPPKTPVKPATSGNVVVTPPVTAPVKPVTSGVITPVTTSGTVKPKPVVDPTESTSFVHDDVKVVIQVPKDFPPKPFRMSDYQ